MVKPFFPSETLYPQWRRSLIESRVVGDNFGEIQRAESKRRSCEYACLGIHKTLRIMPSNIMKAATLAANLCMAAAAADTLDDPGQEKLAELHFSSTGRDHRGLMSDTWSILGYQVAAIGVLYTMPEDVSKWSVEQKADLGLSVWWENASDPVWDKDPHVINYVLHPYWGASYFVRARERGLTNSESFFYAALMSSAYEFGVESLVEKASIQDLIVTPVAGALLGQYFMRVRNDIRNREKQTGKRRTRDKWILALTDPVGSANSGLSRFFGREVSVEIIPYRHQAITAPVSTVTIRQSRSQPAYGFQIEFRW